jgi:signal transduction histidine kinase
MFNDSILFKKLEEKAPKKAELVRRVYEEFEDEIEAITKLFSEFTDHSVKHCESVVQVLEKLVIDKRLLENSSWRMVRGKWRLYLTDNAYLTEDEIVLLFLAILLHDIGMSPKIDSRLRKLLEKAKCGEVEKSEIEEIKRIVRETHHIRSKEFVEENDDLKEIMKKYRFDMYIKALADIVEGHRIDPYDLFSKFKKVYDVRVPLLAFLLEIADDMDIGSHRVDKFISEDWIWFYLDKENIKHVLANMSVETFYREGDRVEYKVYIKDLEKYGFILELVYKWWDKIENRIDRFCTLGILSEREDLDAWRFILPSRIDFRFKVEGAEADCSRRFEVDRRVFADLLSDRVYEGEWMYAFRELISNAFDAIKRRAYEDERFSNPHVNVEINFRGDWTEIVVEDNGIGMSMRDIEDYLLKVGRSLYHELREKEPEKARAINPVGYYGIGFLSSFMLLKNGDNFEGSIEIETMRNGYDAVKVLILNPNLPVVKLKSDRSEVGTRIKIRCRRKDVREVFEDVIEFVKALKDKGKNVRIFPFVIEEFGGLFFTVINSIFEINGKKLEIKLNVKIDGYEVWNEPIKPDLFIDGEKLTQVEVREGNDVYRLEVWTGMIFETQFGLIPIEDLKCIDTRKEEGGWYVLKTEKKEIKFKVYESERLINVNGLSCDLSLIELFRVLTGSRVNSQDVSCVLTVESSQPNFTDLKKEEIEIDLKVIGKIFNELCKKDIYFDLLLSLALPLQDFIEIGAEDFVKKRLRFKDVCGDWITLEEIENNGKKPLVATVFIEKFYDKFRGFFDSEGYHVLSSRYIDFFGHSALDEFFEFCNDCEDCVFDFRRVVKIKNNEFKKIILNEFSNVVAVTTGRIGLEIIIVIVDNPFVKTICKLWKENKIGEDIVEKLYSTIRQISESKGYVTVKDLEKYAEIDEEFRIIYELVKNEMDKEEA